MVCITFELEFLSMLKLIKNVAWHINTPSLLTSLQMKHNECWKLNGSGRNGEEEKNRRILHSRVELEPFHPTMNLAFLCSRTEENMKVLSVFLIIILRGELQTIFFFSV